jgi:hypothetical protein
VRRLGYELKIFGLQSWRAWGPQATALQEWGAGDESCYERAHQEVWKIEEEKDSKNDTSAEKAKEGNAKKDAEALDDSSETQHYCITMQAQTEASSLEQTDKLTESIRKHTITKMDNPNECKITMIQECECTLTQKHHKILLYETIYGKSEDHNKKGGTRSRRKEARSKKRPVLSDLFSLTRWNHRRGNIHQKPQWMSNDEAKLSVTTEWQIEKRNVVDLCSTAKATTELTNILMQCQRFDISIFNESAKKDNNVYVLLASKIEEEKILEKNEESRSEEEEESAEEEEKDEADEAKSGDEENMEEDEAAGGNVEGDEEREAEKDDDEGDSDEEKNEDEEESEEEEEDGKDEDEMECPSVAIGTCDSVCY